MAFRAALCLLSITAFLAAAPGDTVVVYAAVPGFASSVEYTLTVNGLSVPVIKTRSVAIAQFAFAGKADLVITFVKGTVPTKYVLCPKRVAWNEEVSGATISLSLTTPRRVVLHYGTQSVPAEYYDGLENAGGVTEKLFIFAEPLETESPKPGDPGVVAVSAGGNISSALSSMPTGGVLYVGPGAYSNSAVSMQSNKSVYVAAGAVLAAGFTFSNVKRARVFGPGAIDLKGGSGTGIRFTGADSCQASDLMMLQRGYGVHVFFQNTHGNCCRSLKLVTDEPGQTGCNTDGYNPNDDSYNDTVDNTLVYNTDDNTAPGWQKSMESYTFKNSIGWNHGCGRTLKVGTDQPGNHYSYFDWENVDAIGTEWPFEMTWQGSSGTGTLYHHFYIKNLNVEAFSRSAFTMEGSDAYEVYFQNLVLPYAGSRTASFSSSKITSAVVQHMVIGGTVMASASAAKVTVNSSTQNVTWRTDEPVEVNIKAASIYASRAPVSPASFTVSRRGGSTTSALTLKYMVFGSARNGVDYAKIPGEVTIPAGASSADVVITPIAASASGIKTVLLEVQHVTDTTYMLGSDFQAQIAIVSSGAVGVHSAYSLRGGLPFSGPKVVFIGARGRGISETAGIQAFSLEGRNLGLLDGIESKGSVRPTAGIIICKAAR